MYRVSRYSTHYTLYSLHYMQYTLHTTQVHTDTQSFLYKLSGFVNTDERQGIYTLKTQLP